MALGIPIRGEFWQLSYAHESTYGTDPGDVFTHAFDAVQQANMPDPQIDFQSYWMLGQSSKRNWYITYRGKIALEGSIPDITVLNGKLFSYAIGASAVAGAPSVYTHTITEATTLSSMAIQADIFDAAGNRELGRRFLGGKINRATWSASEGDFLKFSIDDIKFINMKDNTGNSDDIFNTTVAAQSPTYVTTQPYLFSYGDLSLGGVTFARIRQFRLSVDNGLEPKYYVTNADSANYLPAEYREGKRNYSIACTIDAEDDALYTELVRLGSYTAVYKGFQMILTLTRGSNDTITITIPDSAPAVGGNAMGCLIRNARHDINSNESLLAVPLEIIGRSLKIVVVDAIASYPNET